MCCASSLHLLTNLGTLLHAASFSVAFQCFPCSNDAFVFPPGHVSSPYDSWGELASKLEDEKFRAEYVYLFRSQGSLVVISSEGLTSFYLPSQSLGFTHQLNFMALFRLSA